MLLGSCVNTPIDCSVFHNLRAHVARCSTSCVKLRFQRKYCRLEPIAHPFIYKQFLWDQFQWSWCWLKFTFLSSQNRQQLTSLNVLCWCSKVIINNSPWKFLWKFHQRKQGEKQVNWGKWGCMREGHASAGVCVFRVHTVSHLWFITFTSGCEEDKAA